MTEKGQTAHPCESGDPVFNSIKLSVNSHLHGTGGGRSNPSAASRGSCQPLFLICATASLRNWSICVRICCSVTPFGSRSLTTFRRTSSTPPAAPARLEFGEYDVLAVGFRVRPCFSENSSRPQSQHLVAAGHRLEAKLLVMHELLFEAFLTLVESRDHAALARSLQ